MQSLRSITRGLSRFTTRPVCVRHQILWKPQLCAALSSTASDNVLLSMDDKTGVATLKMNRKPVNSLSMEFLTDLIIAFDKCEADKNCKGIIFTSNVPNIFSAGLELTELVKSHDYIAAFWRNLQELWLKVYGSKCAVIAAINGHAPAGGCLLALSCDYRIMAQGKFTIGLNETQLGIVPPFWFAELMNSVIGPRQGEYNMMLGRMMPVDEAKSIGLIDAAVPLQQVISTAEETMKQFLRLPEAARIMTKLQLRQPAMNRLLQKREEDIKFAADFLASDSIQRMLNGYLQALSKKKPGSA